jgi:hypothetical protein
VSHGPERKAEGRGGLPLAVAGEQEQQALFFDFFVVHTFTPMLATFFANQANGTDQIDFPPVLGVCSSQLLVPCQDKNYNHLHGTKRVAFPWRGSNKLNEERKSEAQT